MPKGTTAELFSARRGAKADLPDPIGLRQRIISAAPDILCTYDSRGLDAAAVNAAGPRLPHIHFEDAAGAADDGRRLRSAALAGAIIIVPTATLERSALKAWRVPMERLRRIPFGIDLKRLSPLAARDGARPVVTVGAIGELVLDGNFWRLIKAFAAMRARVTAHLAIFGDGPARLGRDERHSDGTEAHPLPLGRKVRVPKAEVLGPLPQTHDRGVNPIRSAGYAAREMRVGCRIVEAKEIAVPGARRRQPERQRLLLGDHRLDP